MDSTQKRPSPYGTKKYLNVSEYLSAYTGETRVKLEEMRNIIKAAVPDATEIISYNMPAFRQHKNLVYFAAAKNHIGLYPSSAPVEHFKESLTRYKTSKGAIQFPLNEPLPGSLIQEIVKYAALQDKLRASGK